MMKDGEREGEICIKACKEERSCEKRKEVPRDKRNTITKACKTSTVKQ